MYTTKSTVGFPAQSQWSGDKVGSRVGPLYKKGGSRSAGDQVPEPHVDQHRIQKVPKRFTGKQMMPGMHVNPGNMRFKVGRGKGEKVDLKAQEVRENGPTSASGVEDGFFGGLRYWAEEFSPVQSYVKSQPPDQRKNGFGSGDAQKRDEFSSQTRTAQWRQAIKSEDKMTSQVIEDSMAKSGVSMDELRASGMAASQKLGQTARDFAKGTQYDRLRDKRDDVYGRKTMHSPMNKISLGSQMRSSGEIGTGVEEVELDRPKFKRVNVVKEFYRQNHGN